MAYRIDSGKRLRGEGFTLLELLVVLAIISVLASLVAPRYWGRIERAQEEVLRTDLAVMREQLDRYFADNGRYPDSLQQLVEKRYLRAIPMDPVTERRDTWIIVPPGKNRSGQVADVKSGATQASLDGSSYRDW